MLMGEKKFKVQLTARRVEINSEQRGQIVEKLERLKKYLEDVLEIQMTLTGHKSGYHLEVGVQADKMSFHIGEDTNNILDGTDRIVERLKRQISKYKKKWTSSKKGSRPAKKKQLSMNIIDIAADESKDSDEPFVVKREKFALKPMSIAEAIDQMKILDQEFLVFSNAGNDEVNVIYKRKDGTYGLIERD
jgi:ribosome hibernation promoting factor